MCGRQKEFGCILRMDAQSPTYFSPQHTTETHGPSVYTSDRQPRRDWAVLSSSR
jgi:hypothetical protein